MSSPSSDPSAADRGPDEAFCRNCGRVIGADARYCPDCGAAQRPGGTTPSSGSALDSALDDLFEGGNPFVAAFLSAVFPGLGQLYNRELEKGLVIIGASVLAVLSAAVLVGFVLYPAVWLYAIYDAYTVADRQSAEGATTGRVRPDADGDEWADEDDREADRR